MIATLLGSFLGALLILVCILLILVVLVQKGRGGGLAGAFGGAGGSSAFGTKTGDVFTIITVIMAAAFLILAIVLNYQFRGGIQRTGLEEKPPAPMTPAEKPDKEIPTTEKSKPAPAKAPGEKKVEKKPEQPAPPGKPEKKAETP